MLDLGCAEMQPNQTEKARRTWAATLAAAAIAASTAETGEPDPPFSGPPSVLETLSAAFSSSWSHLRFLASVAIPAAAANGQTWLSSKTVSKEAWEMLISRPGPSADAAFLLSKCSRQLSAG